ncbi:hypothetical protein [Nocardia africana]|uniref:hypothetical protein n=1 Tax=Nocardia africana TaxID=134964 RepID=UPI000FE19085|nr:hypothetical protein [Nocardia africana]MCC3313762.1 hypothetical protein [Nocardia africana]
MSRISTFCPAGPEPRSVRLTDRSSEQFAIDGKVRRGWAAAVEDYPSSELDPASSDGKRSDMDIQSIISLLLSAGSSVLSLGSSVLRL